MVAWAELLHSGYRFETMTRPKDRRAILVVEDEIFIRIVAADILSDCGLQIYEAGCASEALDLIAAHPEIAILFTDINMPGEMDGLALASRVFAMWPHIGLIVTSGGQSLRNEDVPDSGVFLPKPYRAADLADLVLAKLAA